jgi:hypothetical protein
METAMFFRIKQSASRQYLQIVENFRQEGRVRQRVLTTLGRLDELRRSGNLDGLLASGARFAEHVLLLTAHRNSQVPVIEAHRIGPTLIFERLWQETGCQQVLRELLAPRHFEFSVERAVFLTVLHRLCATGSDRAGQRWKEDYRIDGADDLELHHMYRAMAWLGEALPAAPPQDGLALVPRCTKDVAGDSHFVIDEAKLAAEARYDGTWVLRTNAALPAAEVALQYKKLWMVEHWFRTCKSLLDTRPIFHHRHETIRGHVFCSFLALVLRQELQARLAARGFSFEWADVMRDLERVQSVHVAQGSKNYWLRSELENTAGRVFQSVGVAVPPTVQEMA